MEGPSITQLRELMKARLENSAAQKAATKTAAHKKTMEIEVAEALEAAKIKGTYTVDLGPPYGTQSFKPGKTIYGNIYDVEAFEEWAKSHGFAKDMLGEPKPRKKAINQFVKRAIRVGQKMPDGVEQGDTPFVTVTDKNPKT